MIFLAHVDVVFTFTISHSNQDGEEEGGVLTAAAPADDSLDPAVQAAPAAELSVSDAEVGQVESTSMFFSTN